ncbi:putative disease resistance protein [Prunus yedoensis var. nudiflora]|uniref:Putative disease resistance protein n=1 Tax=Prunus yedoensis var. nudiflora TaxID=2094558 RepID=A0A314XT45_PRUYE|nr:putative disease resistance protein [Prunus yedoensis var. nudiflora]
MAEIIVGVIGPVMQLGQWLWSPAKRGLGYMVHYKRNTESLNLQIEELKVKKNRNQNLVDAFQLNGEEPEIKKWFDDANKAIADAAQLTGEVAASKNCISGMCPDLRWRYNLGKKAMEEKEAVNKLLEKGDFQTISVRVPHPIEIESTMSTGGFQAFGSTRKAMDQVMTALKDDNVTVIGVYGMAGVGKTTMVKHVGAQACKDGLFDHVIMGVFTQNPDLRKLQGQLSDMLGFKLEEETELGRAGRLKERILRGKRNLIILDDIWNSSLELASIGIPSHIELQRCKSKVLLTTRRLNVCHAMESHVIIHLDILSEEDSWNLFAKKARKSFESRNFYNVARKIATECAGLPIALITVARALGDKDFEEWKEAARRLERSQPANFEDEGDVFKCIKLSYDFLKDKDAKSCLLLCSLFQEDSDIAIQDLFSYGFGYGLFRDGKTLKESQSYSTFSDQVP